jgi:hypothetical protein
MQLAPAWLAADFAARLPFIALLVLTCWPPGTASTTWPAPAAPAGALRLRRRGAAHRLRAGHGRRRPAGPDRLPGPEQLSHETTPALAQLGFTALTFYGIAALPTAGVPALACVRPGGAGLSGAPAMAVLFARAALPCTATAEPTRRTARGRRRPSSSRRLAAAAWPRLRHLAVAPGAEPMPRDWRASAPAGLVHLAGLAAGAVDGVALAPPAGQPPRGAAAVVRAGRRWPTCCAHPDRALLLALPALATLAAFALPTFQRSVSALIDWFTLLFFSGCALVIWVIWISHADRRAGQAARQRRQAGARLRAQLLAAGLPGGAGRHAGLGWLVRWRTSRTAQAIWKSLVLPAGGAALCWLLVMTLWLPVLDYARSYAPRCSGCSAHRRARLRRELRPHRGRRSRRCATTAAWTCAGRAPRACPGCWCRRTLQPRPHGCRQDALGAGGPHPAADRRPREPAPVQEEVSERGIIARHAGTVLAGQLATMAFGITDTVVAGRYSQQALAALSVGSPCTSPCSSALMGVLQSLLPIWAELHGAGRRPTSGRSVRQALYLAVLASIAGVVGLLFPNALLQGTEVPPALQQDVRHYLGVLALALPPALLFRMYSTLNQSLGKPQLVTLAAARIAGVQGAVTIWFAFGGAGLPAMGAVG